VQVGHCSVEVISHLGKGSFGSVWNARLVDDPEKSAKTVAIKECLCHSHRDLAFASREVKVLADLADRVADDCSSTRSEASSPRSGCSPSSVRRLDATGQLAPLLRVPSLLASEIVQEGSSLWRVRFVMTKLDGVPLDEFLANLREVFRKDPPSMPEGEAQALIQACRLVRELILQVSETFDLIAGSFIHRDVNSRNILIHQGDGHDPRFGLVDFGMAVEARQWAGLAGSKGSWQDIDIAGDCRFWPPSSWLFFQMGWRGLTHVPALCAEYQTRLDVHGLGITALQTLMESLPSSPASLSHRDAFGALGASATGGAKGTPGTKEARALKETWDQYWSDAMRIWERVLHCVKKGSDPDGLRRECITCGVHAVFAKNLRAMGVALHNCEAACRRASPSSGLAAGAGLFSALQLMIGEDQHSACSWLAVRARLGQGGLMNCASGVSLPGCGLMGCGPAPSLMSLWSIACGCGRPGHIDLVSNE